MEQLARDARITTLYEGTTGIQALDLMGRKTMQLQGAGLRVFLGMVEEFCTAHENDEGLREFVEPLRAGAGEWQALTIDRKSVVSGKSVSVRVDLGGRRIIKKQKKEITDDAEK